MAYTLEELQKMGAKPVAKTAATPSAGSGGYTLEQLQGMGAQPVSRETPAPPSNMGKPAQDGFLKTVIKDPIKTLLVKPAARTTEALGRLGVFGEDAKRGYEIMADEGTGQELDIPLLGGKYNIENVKAGTAGVKQITGEALKAGSYLYGGSGAATTGKTLFGTGKLGTSIIQGAKTGAASGGAYGAGEALEQDKSAVDIAKDTVVGAAIGGIAGGAVPLAVHGATKLAKGAYNAATSVPGAVTSKIEALNQPEAVRKALRTGIDDNVVDFVKTAAPDDKKSFLKMFEMAEKGAKDLRFREQPKQVAGKAILDRASHLIKVKDVGVQQTQRVLNSLDQSPIDASNVLFQFLDDMRGMGITITKRGNGYQLISNGKVPQGDMDAFKLMLQQIVPDENGSVSRSYRGLHTARQRIFNELNLAKARQQTFSDEAAKYAERFRGLLADPIDQASKGKYRLSQRKTADALSALRDFVQLMGYKGNLENLKAKDLRVAEVASRVLGNAADRPTSVLQNVDDVAAKYGYKAKDSFMDQLQFADLLEDVFGTKQTRSLRGQVGRGTLDAVSEATGAAQDVAQMNLLGLGTRAVKAILGKSKDDQIRALKALLEEEVKGIRPSTVFGKIIK
jgi:hypothetical protein